VAASTSSSRLARGGRLQASSVQKGLGWDRAVFWRAKIDPKQRKPFQHEIITPIEDTGKTTRIPMSDTQARIDDLVKHNDVVLFMKGSASFPMCGFSGRAIQILKACGVDTKTVKTVNVLDDAEIRQGIKEYSNWPTIPQLYVKGEFIGGSDIMMEMYESGEMVQVLGTTPKE
jgi:monothiol glutaredoxin